MITDSCLHTDEFDALLKRLPDDREAAAARLGALSRKRHIRGADTLLRLALAYAWLDLSLRNVAAWAQQRDLVRLADVSVMERLQKAVPFLAWLLTRLLQTKAEAPLLPGLPYRVRLIDATAISQPGSRGTDWRVHMQMDLGTRTLTAVEVTDYTGGESLARFAVQTQDLLVGDRIYGTRASLAHVAAAGGWSLVRFAWNLPLQRGDGTPFDLFGGLSGLTQAGQTGAWEVQTIPTTALPAVSGRVIAVRKPAAACEAARRRALENAKKKGRTPDARTLLTCDYVLLFTTVPASVMTAEAAAGLYRYRWQIECGFKRLKSLLNLDGLRAKNAALCQAYLYAKLIGALLTDQCSDTWAAFSPWDGPAPAFALVVAGPADGLVDLAGGGVGQAEPVGLGAGTGRPWAQVL